MHYDDNREVLITKEQADKKARTFDGLVIPELNGALQKQPETQEEYCAGAKCHRLYVCRECLFNTHSKKAADLFEQWREVANANE